LLAYTLYGIGVGILLHTYILYPIFLFILHRIGFAIKSSPKTLSEFLPSITLVIAAFNEEDVIEKKLKNCMELNYPMEKLKIIVSSDGSTDLTNKIVQDYVKRYPRIELLELPRKGKFNAINEALSIIDSEIIVFSDANTIYKSDSVKFLVRHFTDSEIGCVCGRLVFQNPSKVLSGEGESFYWKYETEIKKMESKFGWVAGANGAIYAARASLVEKLPLNTINDDFLISMRIVLRGKKCIYDENSIAYEDVAPTIEGEFIRHIRDGAGHYIAIIQLWHLMNPLYGMRSFIFWSHRLLRWLAPFILISLFCGNLFLFGIPFFNILFVLQLSFYILAFGGFVGRHKKLPVILFIPFYFCNLNLALLFGFFRLLFGLQKTAWSTTSRK
jgi:poly-beta-1,6-N-acetyl-D-glucosamine synthase